MERLPHWVLTNKFPALFDSESATVIEQTARVYGAMQSLIDDYNLFVDKVNEHIQAFEDAATKNYDLFTKEIRQEFQDFIDTVTLKIQSQDRVILEAVEYMGENLESSIEAMLAKYEADGSMDAAVRKTFNKILNDINALSSRMDTFTTLEEGSTTGDAELLDIRVGADGTVYANAGEAVRNQISNLKSDLSELEYKMENTMAEILADSSNWESGTLSVSTGVLQGNEQYIRTNKLLYFKKGTVLKVQPNYRGRVYFYTKDDTYISANDAWIKNGTSFTFADNCYARLGLNHTLLQVIDTTECVNFFVPNEYYVKNVDTSQTYMGEKIILKKNTMLFETALVTGIGQDGAVYNGMFFSLNANGDVLVADVNTGTEIATIKLSETAYIPHANCVVFGKEKYVESDVFPCIYINVYNTTDAPNGLCYVYRILTDSTGIPTSTELVQTLQVDFTDDEVWQSVENETRPHGNFVIDTDRGYLYAFTCRDGDTKTRFFRFYLPSVQIAEYTLSKDKVLGYFDVPYIRFPQGATYYNGFIYCLGGGTTESNPGSLYAINVNAEVVTSVINFYANGYTFEPEFIDVVDDKFLIGQTTGYLITV